MSAIDAMQDVDIAFRQLEFAIKLLSFCELGGIDPSAFDTNHIVNFDTESLHFPTGKFNNSESLIRAAGTGVLITFSVSIIALDNAFERVGMPSTPESNENDQRLRTLIYMMRCAQAHGIAEPRWKVQGKYCRPLVVNLGEASIFLDLSTLDGELFQIDQLGGYPNWYRIRDEAIRVLSTHPAPS